MTEDAMWPRIADVPPLREISLDFRSTLTEHHGLKYEMLMVPIPSQLQRQTLGHTVWVDYSCIPLRTHSLICRESVI